MAGVASIYSLYAIVITGVVVWAAAWIDVRSGRIPNALSVTGAILGLLIFLEADGVNGLALGLAGLGLGLALMLPGYLLHSTGAGDVKLMATVGALLGPQGVLLAFVLSIFTGATMALACAVRAWLTKGAQGPWKRYGRMGNSLFKQGTLKYLPPEQGEALKQRFTFGPAIAIGSTVAALYPLL